MKFFYLFNQSFAIITTLFGLALAKPQLGPGPHHAGPAPGYGHGPAYPDTPPHYNYQYNVVDTYSGVNFGQTEGRDGYATKGEYHVALPDGRIQVRGFQQA